MKIRAALIQQSPSLALQRAAGDEIARLDSQVADMAAQLRLGDVQQDRLLSALIEITRETLRITAVYNCANIDHIKPAMVTICTATGRSVFGNDWMSALDIPHQMLTDTEHVTA